MDHADYSDGYRLEILEKVETGAVVGAGNGVVRLCAGIETTAALLHDLEEALQAI